MSEVNRDVTDHPTSCDYQNSMKKIIFTMFPEGSYFKGLDKKNHRFCPYLKVSGKKICHQ